MTRTTLPTVRVDHGRHIGKPSTMDRLEARTYAEALTALRRVGSEAIQWNRDSGTRIDSRTLAARVGLPGARIFGARDTGRDETPDVGLVLLIDDSGSMSAEAYDGSDMRRADAAAAVAVGMARACSAVGVPVSVLRHDEQGGGSGNLRIEAYTTTRDVLAGQLSLAGGNRDAFAVATVAGVCRFPARHTVFALIADGQPTDDERTHARAASVALRALRARGASFVYAYIGSSGAEIQRAAREWGAARVADARRTGRLSAALVRALAEARAR